MWRARFGKSGAILAGAALAVATATVGSVLAMPAAQAAPSAAPRDALSGVGYADGYDWGEWRGRTVTVRETWNDPDTGSGGMTWAKMNELYTVKSQFSDGKWDQALSLAQPMYAQNETVQSCATTDEITTFMGKLGEAWPRKDAFIRLGWEFNGNWYPWSQKAGDEAAFIACWRKWHGIVKAASPDYKLVWNPNAETMNSYDVTGFWPGAEYVDAAGPDYYGWANTGGDGKPRDPEAGAWNGGPLGINAWRRWVADRGVPFSVPEWGVKDGDWGWTSPDYIVQMRTAFEAAAASPTGLATESYFDGGPDWDCKFSLHSSCTNHQAEAAKYVELFSHPYTT